MGSKEFKEKIISEIETTEISQKEIVKQININLHFVGNPFLEITGNVEDDYDVRFYDGEELIHRTTLKNNMWTRLNRRYYTDWKVLVFNGVGLKIYEKDINLHDKRVYIALGSKSLGDTLAWVPYLEEFRKKHSCELIVSTFLNDLFIEQYPDITFVKPGQTVDNIYAMYEVGWYYNDEGDIDYNRVPNNFRTQPLQKTASDILGLDYKEVRPKLKLKESITPSKKVGIAIHGTAQSKYWNNENGWQEVVDYLKNLGYKVILYSIENDGYMGNYHPKGIKQFPKSSLQDVIYDMQTCEFFIGIGSGLSWLAWSVGIPVVLISGFSEAYTETKQNTYRVINKNVCTGCFNSHKLDAGDWNWCPINKNTNKQFECTKTITAKHVISKIKQIDFDWGFFKTEPNFLKLVEDEIFFNNIYEKYFSVETDDVVLDIGASVGPFTKSIIDKSPKKVYAIEPSKSEYTTLIKNLNYDNVVHINKAIGSKNEENSTSKEVYGNDKTVDFIKFNDFLKIYNIDKVDFIKIDCEGGEYDVFTNENVEFLKTVKKITGEWHLGDLEKREKFIFFTKNILPQFKSYKINSVDGIDITNVLIKDFNYFINYYQEVIIYITN